MPTDPHPRLRVPQIVGPLQIVQRTVMLSHFSGGNPAPGVKGFHLRQKSACKVARRTYVRTDSVTAQGSLLVFRLGFRGSLSSLEALG